jgi:hypothetical protein
MAFVLTDWVQVATAGGALLSGFGLLGTMATVLILVRQTRAVQQASVTSAYQSIISTSSTFNAVLIEHPELYFALTDSALTVEHWDFAEQMRLRSGRTTSAGFWHGRPMSGAPYWIPTGIRRNFVPS